jgi:hypothetical protein
MEIYTVKMPQRPKLDESEHLYSGNSFIFPTYF